MLYMIDYIVEAYRILLMCLLLSYVLGNIDLEGDIPYVVVNNHFLESFMLNLFSILTMYVDCERPNNLLGLSLLILIPKI